ncbi:MAG: PAS domain-containing protein [Desulfovibrio sp.]|nr:MAG: PAS domain-containing protein [Desulfovibrio sp.]
MSFPTEIPCHAVMDSIADGVFTVDLDWNITSFNQAAEDITGVPAQEALGRKCWEVFHSSLCDGQCALGQCLDEDTRLVNKSIFIIRPDGARTPISISAAPLRDEQGKLIGGVETFRDLSDIALLRKEVEGHYVFEDIVGKSAGLTKLFAILPQIAASEATSLVSGESGVGKELFARAIHNLSPRKDGPFIAVNCGALPETLLESELFGYKAGAFTDAKKDKPGRFQLASGGSIFLDEIGDMAPGLQVKLLRVLQEKTFEPLGSVTPVQSDVRVIAATNRDLDELVAQGGFRQDLFYRLNVARMNIPPLRNRPEDIPLLADHFIRRLNLLKDKSIQGLSEDALGLLMRHPFPGNVRELENILEFAFILCPGDFIQVEHLPENFQPRQDHESASKDAISLFQTPMTMDQVKCLALEAALYRNHGKVMATCRELGVSKDTLRRMRKRCAELGE